MRTDVNVPFALQWDKDNQELDLVSKTVMRKQDFKSSNRDFSVETVKEGVGIITPYNTTADVKPGEVQRQANKLALKVKNQDTPMLHGEVLKDLERRWNNGKNT